MKKVQRVIKAKLIVTPSVAAELKTTMKEFSTACNVIAELAHEKKLHRKYDIHHLAYKTIRNTTTLPSQHVVNAIAKVAEQCTREPKKQHRFKPLSSVRFDARTMTFNKGFTQVKLTVCPRGRVGGDLHMSAEMRRQLQTVKTGTADLIFRNGQFYLHIVVSEEAPESDEPTGSLGIDLGVRRVAVTSDAQFIASKRTRHIKNRYQKTRASLQANGSRRSKRVLQRVSGRERRFVTDSNHCLSKQIVAHAKATGQRIVMEDLTGIRKGARGQRAKNLHGWSFNQLQTFTAYKAALEGVEIAFDPAPYTSQTHYKCLRLGVRRSQSLFYCRHCDELLNADLNSALVLSLRHDLMLTGRFFCALAPDGQPALKSSSYDERQAASFMAR
jgi:IS605 OrfB family transposase